jgi:hypothetical protein
MKNVKITAPETETMENILEGVRAGKYYTNYGAAAIKNGYTPVSFGFSVFRVLGVKGTDAYRDTFQEIDVPTDQRGNLRPFAGKKCVFVMRLITKDGQLHGYIKEVQS